LAYRSRDPKLVLETMAQLSERYGVYGMQFADYILPNGYFSTLLPDLAKAGSPYRIFAEVKSNLSEDRFAVLAAAGFKQLQPGIESFSSDALRKMRKGVTAAQNVYTLVAGRSRGIQILYNLLYGFPDDEVEEYERMASLIPRLAHLDPPVTCLPVQILRWAPLQANPEKFGIGSAAHEYSYEMVFSKQFLNETGFELDDFCYLFERPFENAPALDKVYHRIQALVERWRGVSNTSWLYAVNEGDNLVICDKRAEDEITYRLGSVASKILASCGRIKSYDLLAQACPDIHNLADILSELEERGLIFVDETRIVSLLVNQQNEIMRARENALREEMVG
jgi:hypothetical protein